MRILVVEDEKRLAGTLADLLHRQGYTVDVSNDGVSGLDNALSGIYDLVVLDVMLPGVSGIDLLRRMKAAPEYRSIAVVMATARGAEYDKIQGLDLGADYYLAKPFGVRELIARVRALLRRGTLEAPDSGALVAAGITLDEDRHTAVGPNGPIDLTPREFELLAALMKDAGKVVTREDLLREAWGWEYITETKTVDTHIKRLRDKISQAGFDPSIIETVRGYGYRFEG